jgi:hypothetical protein
MPGLGDGRGDPGDCPGTGNGSGGGCDTACWQGLYNLVQCSQHPDACNALGGSGSSGEPPSASGTPVPASPLATPLCGTGSGGCPAPQAAGGGGPSCGPLSHLCHDIRHAVTGCVHGNLNDCVTLPQLVDLLPIDEACGVGGTLVGGPPGGLAGVAVCAPVSQAISQVAGAAGLVQIAFSGCPLPNMRVAVNYAFVNAVTDFPGSFPVEAAEYEGQQRALDC